ncbi:MAG: DivIVA domain-containing protein [Candidatus Rokubacteria bacterium]|nr:DivIVA domain-containing protein [Candidatus Rokubacteria bacterium]
MRISPLDIRQQQFTVRTFRGFDSQEVDAFLDDVAEDYEAVLKENALLKEQVAGFEERARGLAERERALQDTLIATQRLGDEMKAAARREAELHAREAELRGEKILEEVRGEEAKLRSEVQALRRTRRQLIEDLRSTLESYQRLMSAEFGDDAGGTDTGG